MIHHYFLMIPTLTNSPSWTVQIGSATLTSLSCRRGVSRDWKIICRECLLQNVPTCPDDFDDLIRILDSRIRLITPTDPEGKSVDNDSVIQAQAGQKYFQLTHDYLVPALRQWLTHKQKETRKGRAELSLAERSALWSARPESRHLPTWGELLRIRLFTEKARWSEPQRRMMTAAAREQGMSVRSPLRASLLAALPEGLEPEQRETHWKSQAVAAVALVNLGHADEVWPLLEFTPQPSLRSFVIHYLGHLRGDPVALAERLEMEPNVSICRALIQALGGQHPASIPWAERSRIIGHFQRLFVDDPDPGIHGAARWALVQWGAELPSAGDRPGQMPASPHAPSWRVNSQGQTMVIITKPAAQGSISIDYAYAISSEEVTVNEFRKFREYHELEKIVAPTGDCPAHFITWYQAAEYCN